MNYPGIDKIGTRLTYRMMNGDMQHRIGVGFMKKDGIRDDKVDCVPTHYALSYVIRGKGEYIDASGTKYPLIAGSIFQRLYGRRHSTILNPTSRWAECFIDFGAPLCRTLEGIGLIRNNPPVFSVKPSAAYEKEIFRLVCDMEKAATDELGAIFVRALELLARIYAARVDCPPDHSEGFMRQACNLLRSAATDRIDLRILVESKGWGYEWFRKEFRRQMGISPGQYMLRLRLETACNLILTTGLSFGEIADRLGYANQYEFSIQFKKYLGQTPMQYRKDRYLTL